MQNVQFELTGITPLLPHWDSIEGADELQAWRKDPANKKKSVAGDDRSPPWTWQTYCYRDGVHLTFPSDNLMVALRQAGSQITLKKMTTYKSLTQSGLLIINEQLPLFVGPDNRQIPMSALESMRELSFSDQCKACEKLGFRLWAKRAKIGTSKHVRVRARMEQWKVTGSVQILSPDISIETLKQIFEIAGRVGVCDWRPGCKSPGPFGMFKADISA